MTRGVASLIINLVADHHSRASVASGGKHRLSAARRAARARPPHRPVHIRTCVKHMCAPSYIPLFSLEIGVVFVYIVEYVCLMTTSLNI